LSWELKVPPTEQPKKIENFLKKHYPIGYVRKLFRKSGVRLNGRRCGPDEMTRAGDIVAVFIPFEKPSAVEKNPPSKEEVKIIFENELFAVVDKPAGIAVHEGKHVLKKNSLLGKLEEFYKTKGIAPRLVHRLDRDTSGVLLVAKSEETGLELERLFEQGKIKKEYKALVCGSFLPKQGKIDFPLPGREESRVRAITIYSVEKSFEETTLVTARIETGRMHQIRLHFSKLHHPVVMDDEHGDFSFNKRFRKAYGLKRQFLHAEKLTMIYRGQKFSWTAPLSEDLKRTLRLLDSEL